jgi:serine/threonine protein kinase
MARGVLVADFGGRYRLDRRLGAGGMGEVWLAYDEDLDDRPVAIKVMRPRMLADDDDLARFQREMQLASRMQHPNIMTVFTTGSDRGVPFMVMEYLQGSDLGKMPVGWSFDEIARIGKQTCLALAYAHGLNPGVVHRDIKPGNLFICDTGLVKVMDFGLAKAVTGSSLSTTGNVLGTMPYISPEQWLGAPAAFSNDVWAVGCVLYELLTGRHPRLYETPIEHVAAAARGEYVAPLPADTAVPRWLADAVMAMLHPDPLDRPTANEAVAMLSARRAYNVQALVTSPHHSAPVPQAPTRHDMALAGLPRSEAEPPRSQSQLLTGSPLAPTGPVISPQGRRETPPTDVSAEAFLPAARTKKRRKNGRLLISSIAALAVVAAGTYLTVSISARPAASQRTGPAQGTETGPVHAASSPRTGGQVGTPEASVRPIPSLKGVPVAKEPPANPDVAKKIAAVLMPGYGFADEQQQYPCLLQLWDRVSGWDVYAQGPAGQYGIPQALPGAAMAGVGPDWQTNPDTQIKWGLAYIRKTYGSPCAALQHEKVYGYY